MYIGMKQHLVKRLRNKRTQIDKVVMEPDNWNDNTKEQRQDQEVEINKCHDKSTAKSTMLWGASKNLPIFLNHIFTCISVSIVSINTCLFPPMLIRAYMMEHVCTLCLAWPIISLPSVAEAQVTTVAKFFLLATAC